MSKSPIKSIAIFIGLSLFCLFGGCGTIAIVFFTTLKEPDNSLSLSRKTDMSELIAECGEPNKRKGTYLRWNLPSCSSDLSVEVVFAADTKSVLEWKKKFTNGGMSSGQYRKHEPRSVLGLD